MSKKSSVWFQNPGDDDWSSINGNSFYDHLDDSDDYDPNEWSSKRNRKPSHYEIAQKILEEIPIRRIRDVIYLYDKPLYVPATFARIVKLLENILSPVELSKFNVSDFKGGYELFLTKALNETTKEIKIKPEYVLFKNRAFNILTGERLQISPDLVFLHKLNAKYKKEKTPVFDAFLKDYSDSDPLKEKLLLAFLGYCLLNAPDGKCFFVLGTASNSGKSILARLLECLIGVDFVSNISLHDLQNDFSLGNLVGKSLNISMDLDSDALSTKAVSSVKMATGSDSFMINEKYQPAFPYRNTATFIYGTNSPVYLKKRDDPFYERMIVIPFHKSILKSQQDKHLLEKLWNERNGIVWKVMKAAKKLIKNHYVFPEPAEALEMKQSWKYGKNFPIVSFLNNCCDLSDPEAETSVKQLYARYTEYCRQNHFPIESTKGFSCILHNEFDLERKHRADTRNFLGICLLKKS